MGAVHDTPTVEALLVVQLMVGELPVVATSGLMAMVPEAVATPVPVRLTMVVPFEPLVTMVTVPVRVPAAAAVNATLIVHVALTAIAAPQPFEIP